MGWHRAWFRSGTLKLKRIGYTHFGIKHYVVLITLLGISIGFLKCNHTIEKHTTFKHFEYILESYDNTSSEDNSVFPAILHRYTIHQSDLISQLLNVQDSYVNNSIIFPVDSMLLAQSCWDESLDERILVYEKLTGKVHFMSGLISNQYMRSQYYYSLVDFGKADHHIFPFDINISGHSKTLHDHYIQSEESLHTWYQNHADSLGKMRKDDDNNPFLKIIYTDFNLDGKRDFMILFDAYRSRGSVLYLSNNESYVQCLNDLYDYSLHVNTKTKKVFGHTSYRDESEWHEYSIDDDTLTLRKSLFLNYCCASECWYKKYEYSTYQNTITEKDTGYMLDIRYPQLSNTYCAPPEKIFYFEVPSSNTCIAVTSHADKLRESALDKLAYMQQEIHGYMYYDPYSKKNIIQSKMDVYQKKIILAICNLNETIIESLPRIETYTDSMRNISHLLNRDSLNYIKQKLTLDSIHHEHEHTYRHMFHYTQRGNTISLRCTWTDGSLYTLTEDKSHRTLRIQKEGKSKVYKSTRSQGQGSLADLLKQPFYNIINDDDICQQCNRPKQLTGCLMQTSHTLFLRRNIPES